jgi:phenylalanyl-tRNA synthetase beta chain
LTFSFVSGALVEQFDPGAAPIQLLNPIAEQLNVMRPNLAVGLCEVLRFNINRKAPRVRVFELGRVFHRDPSVQAGSLAVAGIAQPLRLGGLAWGGALPEQWGSAKRGVDFFDLKADVEALFAPRRLETRAPAMLPMLHPGQSARVDVDGAQVGWIGALHPSLVQRLELVGAPVLFELDAEHLLLRGSLRLEQVSKFPFVIRDLNFIISSEISHIELKSALLDECRREPALGIVQDVRLFDEYRGKGLENKEKSLAFRVWMQDTERTLNDAEVAQAMARLVGRAEAEFKARLRAQ